MSRNTTIKRILREAAELSNAPSPDYAASPLEEDLFEWHFTVRGPPNSVYSEGLYHGRIVLPAAYPLRPPSFRFTTPNGRFEANREICLSISGHHEETWQPAWGIRTAIVALRSFMETDPKGQLGGYNTTDEARRRFAKDSATYQCSACGRTNAEIIKESEERAKEVSDTQADIEVPEELNMGFRDEMDSKTKEKPSQAAAEEDDETAAIAEGFVETAPRAEPAPLPANIPPQTLSPGGPDQVQSSQQGPPPQGALQPTPTTPLPQQMTQQRPQVPTDTDGVPVWMDRLIVCLVVLLAALVLKIMLGA